MLEPRAAIQKMRPYSPPTDGRHDKIRLDFNENVVGCAPEVAAVLRDSLSPSLLAKYPDYGEARGRLAGFFGVADTELLLCNGTDEAIQALIHTFVDPEDEVLILTPTYAMYRFYAEVAGAKVVEVPYRRDDLKLDLPAALAAIGPRTKAILLANPNNPTGIALAESEIEVLLRAAPDACVLVDEAYFEFHGETMAPRLNEFENLFVSRTFSKAFGVAALRMGCLLSNEVNVAALGKAKSPYSVNMLAVLAACEAIRHVGSMRAYVEAAIAGRQRIEGKLTELGVRYWPSSANFVLFDAGKKAEACLARCREAGVLIRDRRHDVPGTLRVTAAPTERIEPFLRILDELWTCR